MSDPEIEAACARWVDAHFDRWLDPKDEAHCKQDLTAFVREQVEKVIKERSYEEVVAIHRQYGRATRLRVVCEWLESQGMHMYAMNWAKALREKFGKEDDDFDYDEDVRAFETRIAELEAALAGANERAEKHFLRVEALEAAMRRIKAEHTKWYDGRGGVGADAIEAVERIACEVMDQAARARTRT